MKNLRVFVAALVLIISTSALASSSTGVGPFKPQGAVETSDN